MLEGSPISNVKVDSNLLNDQSDSEHDSLFDEINDEASNGIRRTSLARCIAPPIPGLYFDPSLFIPEVLAKTVLSQCMAKYFLNDNVNQIMLFERARKPQANDDSIALASSGSGLPQFLHQLLEELALLLSPVLPLSVHQLLFPPVENQVLARQAIINLYRVGEGISPHVDLLQRFSDGIIGVSFNSGCVMNFKQLDKDPGCSDDEQARAETSDYKTVLEDCHSLYLPPRSIIVLTGDARYKWTHGIEGLVNDHIETEQGTETIARCVRLSITFRWLLPGADVVGSS